MAKTEMVPVFVHKESGERESLLVGVNGKLYQVPCGKTVEVPKEVKEIIDQRERNKRISEAYIKNEKAKAHTVQGVPD